MTTDDTQARIDALRERYNAVGVEVGGQYEENKLTAIMLVGKHFTADFEGSQFFPLAEAFISLLEAAHGKGPTVEIKQCCYACSIEANECEWNEDGIIDGEPAWVPGSNCPGPGPHALIPITALKGGGE